MTPLSTSVARKTLLGFLCLQLYAQQPAAAPPAVQQKTAPPAVADEGVRPLSSDGATSVALIYWLTPNTRPAMRTGKTAVEGTSANLTFPKENVYAPGAIVSFPAGGLNTLRLSYFRTRGQGNTAAAGNLAIFGVGYATGDYLSVGYTLENAKVSFDFLSWPFPVRNSQHFRVKTLWEVQYTAITTHLNAPLKPTVDSDGNPIFNDGKGKSWFVYPTLGMGVEHLVTHNFRWEAKASGFGLPKRAAIWDADAMMAYRRGPIEVMVGAKGFHFKTSPKQEQFIRGTLAGGYVGLRWYPK